MLYPLFRPLLFKLDPETAHELAFAGLDAAAAIGAARIFGPHATPSPIEVMGLEFPNRVGLAAGLERTRCISMVWRAWALALSSAAR